MFEIRCSRIWVPLICSMLMLCAGAFQSCRADSASLRADSELTRESSELLLLAKYVMLERRPKLSNEERSAISMAIRSSERYCTSAEYRLLKSIIDLEQQFIADGGTDTATPRPRQVTQKHLKTVDKAVYLLSCIGESEYRHAKGVLKADWESFRVRLLFQLQDQHSRSSKSSKAGACENLESLTSKIRHLQRQRNQHLQQWYFDVCPDRDPQSFDIVTT